jgi:hypothetical protein
MLENLRRDRLYTSLYRKAANLATARLRDEHPAEWQPLLAEVRVEVGLHAAEPRLKD